MGCSSSTQSKNVSANKPEAKGTLLGAEVGADAAKQKTGAELKVVPLEVGNELDTPYGKGMVEELKQGDAGVTYAIVKLSSGFVSVPRETADQWLAVQPAKAPLFKLGNLEVGAVMETPYGKGTLEALKQGVFDDDTVIFAVVQLGSGFVSVPVTTAEGWMGTTAAPAATTQEEEKAPEQEPVPKDSEQQEPAAAQQPVAKSEPIQEEGTTNPPFPETAVPVNVEPAKLEAEIINTERGFVCGRVNVARCGCAEGFEKPQETQVVA